MSLPLAVWAISILIVLPAAAILVLRGIGRWLVTEDPLRPAVAIFVHGGHVPFRAMEAADLYRQGFAPHIWLTQFPPNAEELALAELGIEIIPEHFYNRRVLETRGVPPEAIVVLAPSADTRSELQKLYERLRDFHPGAAVILVTSRYHGRRVKAMWRRIAGSSHPAIVRIAKAGAVEPQKWLFDTRDLKEVAYEVFGILNLWAGFPVRRRG